MGSGREMSFTVTSQDITARKENYAICKCLS
jgi:hypothetical protein